MNNQKNRGSVKMKNFRVLLPIGLLYLIGIMNVSRERRHDNSFLDNAGPWIGYICITLATLLTIVLIYSVFKGLNTKK